MNKTLAVIFCVNNARKEVNIDKNIINAENYLDDNMAKNNNLAINQESADVEPQNYKKNAESFLKELFANAYKNDKLVQATIDAKVRSKKKLLYKILKQVKLFIKDLEVKNSRLYVQDNIYIPDNKNLQLYLLRKQHNSLE